MKQLNSYIEKIEKLLEDEGVVSGVELHVDDNLLPTVVEREWHLCVLYLKGTKQKDQTYLMDQLKMIPFSFPHTETGEALCYALFDALKEGICKKYPDSNRIGSSYTSKKDLHCGRGRG